VQFTQLIELQWNQWISWHSSRKRKNERKRRENAIVQALNRTWPQLCHLWQTGREVTAKRVLPRVVLYLNEKRSDSKDRAWVTLAVIKEAEWCLICERAVIQRKEDPPWPRFAFCNLTNFFLRKGGVPKKTFLAWRKEKKAMKKIRQNVVFKFNLLFWMLWN